MSKSMSYRELKAENTALRKQIIYLEGKLLETMKSNHSLLGVSIGYLEKDYAEIVKGAEEVWQ